ncbi:MAG TPA: pyruvate formate-lyase-activating protein [Candidatus Gracilibacteria bacterium]|nr:pyruvate formate-lyase-activating protein [Candidatus Gracilibacteria bacterium]
MEKNNKVLPIHSVETFGTHEGPGIRLVIFVQGCPLRCLYCHNPDTQDLQFTKSLSMEEVLAILDKQRPYLGKNGGITISGGEPLLYAGFIEELFTKLQAAGYHTVLDSSGAIWNEEVKKTLDKTDLLLLDVKHIDAQKYKNLCQGNLAITLKVAEYREQSGKPMWLRYVLVPGYTDQTEDLENWAKHFQNYQQIERVEILPYHTLGVYKYEILQRTYDLAGVSLPTKSDIEKAKNIFQKYFSSVIIR